MVAGVMQLMILISAHHRGMRAFDKAERGWRGVAMAIRAVSIQMGLLIGMMAVNFMGKAIVQMAEFEHKLAQIDAIMGQVAGGYEILREEALALARTTMWSANQVTDAMFFMTQAGLDVIEVTENVIHVLNLAQIGIMELGQASDLVTDIMRALAIEEGGMAHVTDVLAETFGKYNTTVEQLGLALSYVAPLGRILGMEIEILSASIGILSSASIKGERAGTAMRNILTKLINPSMQSQRVLDRLAVTIYDAQGNFLGLEAIIRQFIDANATATDVMQVFQMRAGPAFLVLMDQLQGTNRSLVEMTEHLQNVEGAAQTMADIIEASPAAQIEKFKARVQEFMIMLGMEFMPILDDMMRMMFTEEGKPTPALDAFLDAIKRLIPAMNTLVSILGVTFRVIGWIVDQMWLWKAIIFILTTIISYLVLRMIEYVATLVISIVKTIWHITVNHLWAQSFLKVAVAAMAAAAAIGFLTAGLSIIIGAGVTSAIFGEFGNESLIAPTSQMGRHMYRSGYVYAHGGEDIVNRRLTGESSRGPGEKSYGKGGGNITNNYIYVSDVFTAERQRQENRRAELSREYQ